MLYFFDPKKTLKSAKILQQAACFALNINGCLYFSIYQRREKRRAKGKTHRPKSVNNRLKRRFFRYNCRVCKILLRRALNA